jgi:hypothetical protein
MNEKEFEMSLSSRNLVAFSHSNVKFICMFVYTCMRNVCVCISLYMYAVGSFMQIEVG